jgi:hypothetical protein
MVFLAKADLPWLNTDSKMIAQMKSEKTPEEICSNLPPVFGTILTYAKQL